MIVTPESAFVDGIVFGGFFSLLIGICIGIVYMEWVQVVNPGYRKVFNFKRKPWHDRLDERYPQHMKVFPNIATVDSRQFNDSSEAKSIRVPGELVVEKRAVTKVPSVSENED